MKCLKCSKEWTAPQGESMNFCSNCGASMQIPALTAPPTDNVIKSLVMSHNLKDKLFLEPSRLYTLAADELRGSKSEVLKHIKFAAIERVPQNLYALKPFDEHERLLKMNGILNSLMRSFNESTSHEIINLFAEALGFSLLKTKSDRKQSGSEKALVQNGVSDNSTAQVKPTQGDGGSRTPKVGELYHFVGRDWRILVIKNRKALILSEKIIEIRAYNEKGTRTTWAECTLQSYLNEAFYYSLGQEKSRIAKTRIVTPDNPWYVTDGGSDIENWIFLLSIEEVVQYLCDIKKRNASQYLNRSNYYSGISYTINTYSKERKAYNYAGIASRWWLRSPGDDSYRAAYVDSDGCLRLGSDHYDVSDFGGVRPALWLKL